MARVPSFASPWELRNARRVQRLAKVSYVDALAALRRARGATPAQAAEDVRARTERIVEAACETLGNVDAPEKEAGT